MAAGPHLATWDGLNNDGTNASAAQYQIKLLYNNVSYEWGVIGDTSASLSGPNNWDMQGTFPIDATVAGDLVITANGYAEGRPNASSFALGSPQSPQALFNSGQNVELQFAATDGQRVYFGNTGNGWAGSVAFVIAYDAETRQQYRFPSGAMVGALSGVVDLDPNFNTQNGTARNHLPTGIAVQKTGNLLAVSHGSYTERDFPVTSTGEDEISLFDKLSGLPLGKVKIHDPQRLAFAANGDLWVISGEHVVKLSSVNFQNTVTVQLQGVIRPLAIAVDPRNGDILVADGGASQQIKRFSSNGEFISSYGQRGGYTDCDPTITPTRLYLDSTAGKGAGNGQLGTWLAVQNDGSYWLGDLGNDRALHISSSGSYLEQFAFLPMVYHVTVDHGDPRRVFADTLEYETDYSKDLLPGDPDPSRGGNGSWSLVRNWSVCLPSRFDSRSGLSRVITLNSGRTYAELYNVNTRNWLSGSQLLELAELPKSGPVIASGQTLMDRGYNKYIDDSGDLAYWVVSETPIPTSTITAYKQTLLQEVPDGFPRWSPPFAIGQATADGSSSKTLEPLGYGGWGMQTFPKPTSNGHLITYKTFPIESDTDYHLGGILLGSSDWSWKASRSAALSKPDNQGSFTKLNSFGGHNGIAALVDGNNVVEGYDGQYGSFSSQWMHWWDDGLMIGQFGHPADGLAPNGTLFEGAAGNIATMASVTVGDSIYLYNSDESYHPGVHRWKISGLGSIKEIGGTTYLGQTVILGNLPKITEQR
jgi:hypothetical protein